MLGSDAMRLAHRALSRSLPLCNGLAGVAGIRAAASTAAVHGGGATGVKAEEQEEDEEKPSGVASASVGPHAHLEDGPILADFLAMGAGRTVPLPAQGPPASPLRPPRATSAVHPKRPQVLAQTPEVVPAPPVRERRLVEAALQRSEVLGQALLETPPRTPLTPPRRRRECLPEIFLEAHAGYTMRQENSVAEAETQEGPGSDEHWQAVGERSPSTSREGHSGSVPRNLRLRVRPWHRTAMQQLLCRAVLFHFLQDLREALGLRAEEAPLFLWEVTYAWQQIHKGEVVELVKYLAETELHVLRGPVRRELSPGNQVGAEEMQRVRAERRELASQWRLWRHTLEEDAILRVFLDGRLCWPRIRSLIGGPRSSTASASPSAATASSGSPATAKSDETAALASGKAAASGTAHNREDLQSDHD